MSYKLVDKVFCSYNSHCVNIIMFKQLALIDRTCFYRKSSTQFRSSVSDSLPTKITNKKCTVELKPKTRKSISQSQEISNYLASKGLLSTIDLPANLLKKKRTAPDAFYLVDKDIAKRIVKTIKPFLLDDINCPILEANPGFGFITSELLAEGFPQLHLYESYSLFLNYIKKLQVDYPNRIELKKFDLLFLYKQAFQDKMDNGSRVKNMLNGIVKKEWNDDPAMKIIAALPSVNFIKHLIISFIFQNGIMTYGRPELYLIMHPPLYIHLTCDSSAGYLQYRSTTVLFQLLFNIKFLDKLPRQTFLPWEVSYIFNKNSKLAKVKRVDPESLYLVRIEPRRELFQSVITKEKLQPLWYFINQNMMSRKNRVIPQLEKWVPGCGPRLIQGGMDIFTQFGDLTPNEIVCVFNEFCNWPEYLHSTFLPSMETNFLKTEGLVEEEVDKDVDETDHEV